MVVETVAMVGAAATAATVASDARAALRDRINDNCIVRVPPGSRELPSIHPGQFYTWQFYLRRALFDAAHLRTVADDFWSKAEADFAASPFQVAGVESASTPVLTAIVMIGAERGLRVNAFSIRKERKTYGLRNLLEGEPNDLPVLLVDDLTSPMHRTLWLGVQALSSAALRLHPRGYVVVYKGAAEASRVIRTPLGQLTIDSMFTLSDFSPRLADYRAEKGISA